MTSNIRRALILATLVTVLVAFAPDEKWYAGPSEMAVGPAQPGTFAITHTINLGNWLRLAGDAEAKDPAAVWLPDVVVIHSTQTPLVEMTGEGTWEIRFSAP